MSESLNFYLNGIGKIPLMTADEEIHLGSIVREWLQHTDPSVSLEKRGRRAMNRMVQANLRLVVSVCRHYHGRATHLQIDPMDLIQSANLGLIRAVELYDPCRGYKFSTYAYWWIKHGIMRHFHDHAGTIRLPAHVVETAIKAQAMSRELGASAPLAKVAEKLSITSERLNFVLERYSNCRPLSLDQELGGADSDGCLGDLVCSTNPDQQIDDYNWIHDEIAKLDSNERHVLTCRYGQQSVQSLAQTAERLGITKAKAQRIEQKALQQLRRRLTPMV
jgi:hypothetical protein